MIYFHSFGQLQTGNEVFVAMPMRDSSFTSIWADIHSRAIESLGLTPFRVNIPQTGDSILIEILSGLRRARLALVDISPDTNSGEHPNANVMYELGIAHATRLPETVIVVRKKNTNLPFDVSHIRVFDYDSTDPVAALASVRSYLGGALAAGRTLREDVTESAWSAMDPACRDVIAREWYIVSGAAAKAATIRGETFDHPHPGLFEYPVGNVSYMRWRDGQVRAAFARLQEFGIIEATETEWHIVGRQLPVPLYRFTLLGQEVGEKFTRIT